MTQARSQQISLDDTPYYHCISRCVRRAYLCGEDPVTGRNFDHRKKWLSKYEITKVVDFSENTISYDDFVNKELIHFSQADCRRSIPDMRDGLKP